ncbi:hypothetical protein TFLX_05274 [Thermoflexales bacterium]|nr:hypothetical protein TFLX_05274 [Thermoflexales bacterium]
MNKKQANPGVQPPPYAHLHCASAQRGASVAPTLCVKREGRRQAALLPKLSIRFDGWLIALPIFVRKVHE